MCRIQFALALGLLGITPALADGLQIDQNASANYSFVAVTKLETSKVKINQAGRTNVISSAQLSPDLNQIATTQSGWFNSIVIYQDGFIDVASVTQSAPSAPPPDAKLPTSYDVRNTDQGFLSTFNSGELSIVTLTSPEFTYVSHFGRRH